MKKNFFDQIKTASVNIKHKHYTDSEYNRLTGRGAKKLSFASLNGFFRQIKKAAHINNNRKFIYAYWDKLDSLCHRKGVKSREVKNHFDELDKKIESLAKSLKNDNTAIIVTADHGQIDTEKGKVIELKNHPKFVETLAMPLCDEPRAAYCYVRPQKVKQFENYVKTVFKKICEIHKSSELIKNNYFGLFEPNKKLQDRVGDYVLIMKENYIMKDLVFGEEKNIFIGNHGGLSKEEMFVPLIVIK